MAFSLRKMLSNMTYFKKPGEEDGRSSSDPNSMEQPQSSHVTGEPSYTITFEHTEPDSTWKQATSFKLPESVKQFTTKKSSLSDTDLLTINVDARTKQEKRRSKKLKLDIKKANKSMDEYINCSESSDEVENTPKHILLECKSSEIFSEKIRNFDLSKSFDIFDAMSDDEASSYEEENMDIESLSDSEISLVSNRDDKSSIKMCRKVDESEINSEHQLVPSVSPESFGDVEIDKNEEERITLLLNYQMKLEKMECFLKKLLGEFHFHIEVSKIFHCRSIVTALPGTNVNNIQKILEEVTYMDNLDRGISPSGSWNIIMEKEDDIMKFKLKKLLLSMKHSIDQFVKTNLQNAIKCDEKSKPMTPRTSRRIALNLLKDKQIPQKRLRINTKKKLKHFDFPDFRDSMINLFNFDSEDDSSASGNNITNILSEFDESDMSKCHCRCHMPSLSSQTDSGVTTKSNERSMSITSSIGNFSLDSTTLTAYSESLDLIVSYNSFQDTSLYSMLLQKAAIERITFYVQVHSIQLNCQVMDQEYESKNAITFYCPTCRTTENEENGLLQHILSQTHCERIHFQYKTAYIKKCVQSSKEIQPSTVLNPMKMYRDDNKIVCFGDAMYACSLCFENLIIGESILMAHCLESEHVERKEKLGEILE